MLSPFVILILALPLLATSGLADEHLLRWTTTAATALLSLGLAARDGKLVHLATPRRLAAILGLTLLVPALFALLAPADPLTVLLECARLASAALLGIAAWVSLGPLAAQRLAPLQAAAPALLLLADRAIRSGLFPGDLAVHPREITATLGNTALVAECAMISLPFLLLAMRRQGRATAAALLFGLGGPLVYLLLVSDSRGAWIGAIAALLVWAGLGRRETASAEDRRRRLSLTLAAFLVLIACLGAASARVDLVRRVASIADPEHPTNRVRIELWRDAGAMGADHLVAGVGPGRFGAEHGRYRSAAEWRISGLGSRVEDPHDEPLRLFAETGLAGLALTAAGLALLLRGLLRRLRTLGPAGDASRAVLAAWAGFLAMSLTWGSLRHPATLVPLALFTGLALRERRSGAPEPARRSAGLLVLLPAAAVFFLLLAQAEREGNAVQLRDRAEVLKRAFAAEPDGRRRLDLLVELGDVGRALVRAAGSGFVSVDLRHRLVLTVANLAEERQRVLAAPAAEDAAADAQAMLQNAARRLPELESARELCELQLELAPAQLATRKILARLDRLVGRKPEAILGLENILATNADDPEARILLAELMLEGGSGLYPRAIEILEEQVARYPRLQPVADRGFEQLARCRGASREIDAALATVARWIEHCGEDDGRRAVAGELALHFGETDETLGRFLAEAPEWLERQTRGNDRVAELQGRPATAMLQGFLAHLGRHPHDTPVLLALGDLLAQEELLDPRLDEMKDRAIALGRCHFVWEGLLGGDAGPLHVHLRIARNKNPASGDPFLLEIIAAARAGEAERALGALKDLVERGFAPRAALSRRPELADFLGRPEAIEVLEGR